MLAAGQIHRPRANVMSRDGLISRLLSTEEIDDPRLGGSLGRKAFNEQHDARRFVRSLPDVSMNSSNAPMDRFPANFSLRKRKLSSIETLISRVFLET